MLLKRVRLRLILECDNTVKTREKEIDIRLRVKFNFTTNTLHSQSLGVLRQAW